jgi:hypothetical protein
MRFMILLLAACNGPETNVKAGLPELVLDLEQIDFGEVILGRQATVELSIYNDGIGDLTIDAVTLDSLSSPEFSVISTLPIVIEGGEYGGPSVRYIPDAVGQDFGRMLIASDDPDRPEVELELSAFGVEPLIDVDPGTLWFGAVESGELRTLTVSVAARGTGILNIQEMAFSDGADAVFSVETVGGVELPYQMVSGTSFSMEVSYLAQGKEPWDAVLTLNSNDPTTPEYPIILLANTKDDPTQNEEPVVEITDPNWGEYYLTGQPIPVTATVYDQEDGPDELYCYLLAGGTPTGTGGTPDDKGTLQLAEAGIPDGDTTLTVRCIDTAGALGEDSVEISVFDPKEPLAYTITGGPTLFDYWSVDDDVTVYVNGTAVFSDTNRSKDTHPPLEFEAGLGDTIKIVASDVNYCQRQLDALTLHFGTNYAQALNGEICQSACPEDACYDSALDWEEGAYFTESYVITIP